MLLAKVFNNRGLFQSCFYNLSNAFARPEKHYWTLSFSIKSLKRLKCSLDLNSQSEQLCSGLHVRCRCCLTVLGAIGGSV